MAMTMAIGIHGDSSLKGYSDMRIGGDVGQELACDGKSRALHADDGCGAVAGEADEKWASLGHEALHETACEKGRRQGGSDTAFGEGKSENHGRSPRSRRVGIVFAPQNCKRPQSLLDLKDGATLVGPPGQIRRYSNGNCTPTLSSPPAVPPRSPLRPTALRQDSPIRTSSPMKQRKSLDITLSTNIQHGHQEVTSTVPPHSSTRTSRPNFRRHSMGSLAALLETLAAEPASFHDKALPRTPSYDGDSFQTEHYDGGEELDLEVDSASSSDSFAQELGNPSSPGTASDADAPPSNPPTSMTKRMHALRELLSSERAYASDLALIRDIHIPLALGMCSPSRRSRH